MDLFRDRIIEFKKERAGDILDNPKNWRVHPGEQSEPLKGLLKQVGKVGALISYYSERLQKQAYIDGHLRKNINPDEMWWICYTDLTDDEADLVLASYDPIGAMAQADKEKLDALLQNVHSDDAAVQRMLAELAEKEGLYQSNEDELYSRKIEAPIYEPKNEKPNVSELFDNSKTVELINEINNADGLTEDEKEFLKIAAQRHTVINFSKVADFYAHANIDLQRLMENSALVIIDFDRAIELGFVKLADDIAKLYGEDYPDD